MDERDWLLEIARTVVMGARRAEVEPARVADLMIGAWHASQADAVPRRVLRRRLVTDPGFRAHGTSGVEGLAFIIANRGNPSSGGIVLRLEGEYPDSFESVELIDTHARTTAAVWAAYFDDHGDQGDRGR